MFVYPGLSRASWRQFLQGVAAVGAAGIAFLVNSGLIASQYPDESERLDLPDEILATPLETLLQFNFTLFIVLGVLAVIVATAATLVGVRDRTPRVGATLLFIAGILGCASLNYHF